MLNVAIKAARAAGAIINRAALDVESVRVSQKQVNDFVTEVDHASEQAIIETLLTAYPDHAIWAEESGKTQGRQGSDHVWIIDPLDGTTNFIHGFPVYCVSIALAVRGKVEQAVVYDPTRNDLFTATRGRGAMLNDRRIRVSKRTELRQSLVSTGFPYRKGDALEPYLRRYTAEIEPRYIMEFLLFDEEFPRSIRFATARIEEYLVGVSRHVQVGGLATPERLAGRLKARLQFADVDELEATGASGLLTTVVNECARVHEAIYDTFVAYSLEMRLPA